MSVEVLGGYDATTMPEYDAIIAEQQKLVRLREAKLLAKGGKPSATLVLPGEPTPDVDFGVEDAEETRALMSIRPEMLKNGISSWLADPDGVFRQRMLLPGERAQPYFEKVYKPHRATNFRSNAFQLMLPKNAEGGVDYAQNIDYSLVQQPYMNPRGPFMARHIPTSQEHQRHHRVMIGARHMDALMSGANAYAMNQRMFGCPIPSYAQPTPAQIENKRRRLNAHFTHIKNMKGLFSPATLNHVSNTENAFMTSLTDKVDAKITSEVVGRLANDIPGMNSAQAESVVKNLQAEHALRFGTIVPNVQAPFSIYKTETWHPEAHGIDSTGGFAMADAKNIDYTSKGTRLFGRGLAVRYGDAKRHVFTNVYTIAAPEGKPLNTTPFSTTWYPHEEGSDAYIMTPAGNPQYGGVTFQTPISGGNGVAFLGV